MARAHGLSLHAGVSCEGHQKDKRERLCRYIARPAVAVPRLSLSSSGKVVYTLKTPYRESLPHERSECFGHGTTHVGFEGAAIRTVDFMARLAALVPTSASPSSGQFSTRVSGLGKTAYERHQPEQTLLY